MALLIVIHPIRVARMVVQAALEWLREEYERAAGELARKRTHSEGLFPFIRVLSNVIVRELQTMAIVLDVYLGVPIIYSTFMQYDELGHHFGPSSFQALRDLRRTDARIREIRRMIDARGRPRVRSRAAVRSRHDAVGELSRAVRRDARQDGAAHSRGRRGAARSSAAQVAPRASPTRRSTRTWARRWSRRWRRSRRDSQRTFRRGLRRVRDWMRSKYGIRELILPEKYRVEEDHEVVVTYSSCLALLYFADVAQPLDAHRHRA